MQRKESILKDRINNWVTTNGNREITGYMINDLLIDIVESSHLSNSMKWFNSAASLRGFTLYKNIASAGLVDSLNFYYFDETSNLTDDGIDVIKPTEIGSAELGRWLRERSIGTGLFEALDIGSGLNAIKPISTSTKEFRLEENSDGSTINKITNTNDVDNTASAIFEVKGSGAINTNNAIFAKFGSSYWVASWADKSVLATDKSLRIGALGTTSDIIFQIGGSYSAPNDAVKINSNRVLSSLVLNYETLISADNDFITKKYFDLNSGRKLTRYSNELPVVTGGQAAVSPLTNLGTHATDKVTNVEVYLNGYAQIPETGNDYILNALTGVITFEFNLESNDIVLVNYNKQDA